MDWHDVLEQAFDGPTVDLEIDQVFSIDPYDYTVALRKLQHLIDTDPEYNRVAREMFDGLRPATTRPRPTSVIEFAPGYTQVATLLSHRLPDRWTTQGPLYTFCTCRDGTHWIAGPFANGQDDGTP